MPQRYQPLSIRRRMQDRIQERKDELDPQVNPLAKSAGRHNWEEQKRKLKGDEAKLSAITPPKIKGGERKVLQARVRQLEEAIQLGSTSANVPPMPSNHQMQDNTDGSTDQHLRHENIWKNQTLNENGELVMAKDGYGGGLELKDLYLRLATTDGDLEMQPSAGSLESLRSGHKVPLHENHAPVQFQVPRKNYDEAFPEHEPTEGEVAAGIYHRECAICGGKSIDKFTPRCEVHQSIVEGAFSEPVAMSA